MVQASVRKLSMKGVWDAERKDKRKVRKLWSFRVD